MTEPFNHDMNSLIEFYTQHLFTDSGRQAIIRERRLVHSRDCECGGEGWLWGHELLRPPEVVTDTRYSCDRQRTE